MAPNPPGGRRPRIALYGHDTQGLGHLRRNLHLGCGLAADVPGGMGADVLLLTGAVEVGLFERPPGVEAIVVPGVRKDAGGGYRPLRLRGHGLGDLVDLRSSTLAGALRNFAPDVFVVDKTPWGFAGELGAALPELSAAGTRLVLGLRDVFDEPAVAAGEWRADGGDQAIRTVYDEVWVYGDRRVHDLPRALEMGRDVRAKVHHLGYVCGTRSAQAAAGAPHPSAPALPEAAAGYVLVMVGGGQDGLELAEAAVRMPLPPGLALILLTGPQMPSAHVDRLVADAGPGAVVLPFTRDAAAWLAGARAGITMGGANTVTEILATRTPALIVPRIVPRREQAVRAAALSGRGLVDMLLPCHLGPSALGDWLAGAVTRRVDRSDLDLGGVRRARDRVRALLRGPGAQPRLRPAHACEPGPQGRAAGAWRRVRGASPETLARTFERSRHGAFPH